MFFKFIYNLGDKLEDKVRSKLSHFPIIYAFIGGAGVIIFWRGVWHTVDYLMELFFSTGDSVSSTSVLALPWWDGPLSMLVGGVLLLTVGLFVTSFIGNEIIISGLKQEKKIVEKTEDEIRLDIKADNKTNREIHEIDTRLKTIEKILKKK
ncbi:MAG: hypothetical protein US58_C0026G0002 [Candidatus Magasanikbacteria bacterium GW2011_GWA2_37_8]|uniref:Uncharacterized protein n=1 Tax=Candidatus Magasanikbacteria bacterium GW2011_GWA2_37_8 TaxID=1619036 RepID=A0A0G0KH23_9BACT|nr:MAG: hypothetical protein US58_C0026G0002 [Candidatus Magasanikbacteria bacterium GW2011_GWA2_37_8]